LPGKTAKSAGRGIGNLSNPLIPHAEKENSCAEVPKDGVIELAGGQVVFSVKVSEKKQNFKLFPTFTVRIYFSASVSPLTGQPVLMHNKFPCGHTFILWRCHMRHGNLFTENIKKLFTDFRFYELEKPGYGEV